MVWSTKSIFYRDMAGNQIDQRRGMKNGLMRRVFPFVHQLISLDNRIEATYARADHHTGTVLRLNIIWFPA